MRLSKLTLSIALAGCSALTATASANTDTQNSAVKTDLTRLPLPPLELRKPFCNRLKR